MYSIDEQWICCRMNPDNALEYAAHIRREVWRRTRIPVSIGCATTLTLSKAASKIAKSNGMGSISYHRQLESYKHLNRRIYGGWNINRKAIILHGYQRRP
ncbi:hypothetical protein [Vibrio alginolyticus]|uniref:Y-family DNA polymerase n=1 Tax=Vibrio alginolyticus TaxID=663 RepID=UPI0012FA6E22